MNIKYTIQEIANSQGSGKGRKHVRIVNNGILNGEQLKQYIQDTTTLTDGDVDATLLSIRSKMICELSMGNRFYIPQIGYFTLSASVNLPKGTPIDKVKGYHIQVQNIKFKPEASLLRKIQEKVTFSRSQYAHKSKAYTEEEMIQKVREYLLQKPDINRAAMEIHFGLTRSTAQKWLRILTEKGVLRKEGNYNSPYYVLSNKEA